MKSKSDNSEHADSTDLAVHLESVYARRAYDSDPRYSEFSDTYLHRIHSIEIALLSALRRSDIEHRLAETRTLDFGCGNGHWMARIISWGIPQEKVFGVDIRASGVAAAHTLLPGCQIECNASGIAPFPDKSFDLILAILVFTSIAEDTHRKQAAMELSRLLQPNGTLVVVDFAFNNPANADVRRLTPREVQSWFPDYRVVANRSVVLAPPIASKVAPRARWLSALLESLPFLRTHFLMALRKPS